VAAIGIMMIVSIADIPLRATIGAAGPVLRDGVTLATILVTVVLMRHRGANLSVIGLIFMAMIAHSAIGIATMGSTRVGFSQVGFGIKLLLPFFAGMCLWTTALDGGPRVTRMYYACWGIACLGVVLDWFGLLDGLNHVETTVDGVRGFGYQKYYAADVTRISGFSRNWGSAAANIALLALILVAHTAKPGRRWLIVIMSLWPLWLTNTKSMIIAFVVTVAVKLLAGRRADLIYRFMLLVLVLLVVLTPIVMSGVQLHSPDMSSFGLWSFVDRVRDSWPRAWRIINTSGLGVLGRGIGGVGSPQYVWDPTNYTSADNLFMLAYGYFGVAAFPYFVIICVAAARAGQHRPSLSAALMILICELCSGITATILENPFDAFACGAAVVALIAGGSTRAQDLRPRTGGGRQVRADVPVPAASPMPPRVATIADGKFEGT